MVSTNPFRAWVAAILLVLGVLMVPLTLAAEWVKSSITNTTGFVELYGPLIEDPQFQDYLSEQGAEIAIASLDDIGGEAMGMVGGALEILGIPASLLNNLSSGAGDSLRSFLEETIHDHITSQGVANGWNAVLRDSHTGIVRILTGDSPIVTTEDTTLELQVAPLISSAREQLINEGAVWARFIPTIDMTIPLTTVSHLPELHAGYQLIEAIGPWILWVNLALIILGITVANFRARALGWAAGGVALTAGAVLLAVPLTGSWVLPDAATEVSGYSLPSVLWKIGTEPLAHSAAIVAGVAVVAAIVGLGAHVVMRRQASSTTESA